MIAILQDDDEIECSHQRLLRVAEDVAASIRASMPEADPARVQAAANNVASAFGQLGLRVRELPLAQAGNCELVVVHAGGEPGIELRVAGEPSVSFTNPERAADIWYALTGQTLNPEDWA